MIKFIKLVSAFLCLLTVVLMIGRNHLILGTFLVMSRWFLLALMMFLYFVLKKKSETKIKKYLLMALVLLAFETTYVKLKSFDITKRPTSESSFKLISYNVYFKNPNKLNSYNVFKNEDADLLLFQEVTPSWNSFLDNKLSNKYSVKKALNGTHGISAYSKHPLKLLKYFNNSSKLPYAQIFEMSIGQKKVLVCNAHLASPAKAVENPDRFLEYYFENYDLRVQQFETINKYIKENESKYDEVIFSGDLNTTECEPLYRDFCYDWSNACKSIFEVSFPNSAKVPSLINLDFIFTRNKVKVNEFKVLKGGSSDHQAIYSEISF